MAKRVQRRRGTTTEHATFTGSVGETTVDTTKDTVVVHDGSTAGGFPLAREDLSNINLVNAIGITELKLTDGSAGQVLKTDGSGTISFTTVDVTGAAVGGDISGTVGNAQIVANKVGITELNVSDGTSGQALTTNGSGTLSFSNVLTDPALGGHLSGTTSAAVINQDTITAGMLTTALKNFTIDEFTGNGVTTTFNLTDSVGSINALLVYINGVVQPTAAYALPTATSIQFLTAPTNASVVRCLHLGFQSTVGTPSDGSITAPKIASNAVTSAKILDGTIATADLDDDIITDAKIASQTITESSILPNTITNISIANNTITGTQLLDNAVDGTKIALGSDTQGDIMHYDGANWARLGPATSGWLLKTNGANANPSWIAPTSAGLPATGVDGNVLTSDGTSWASEAPLGGVGGEIVSHQFFITEGTSTWTRPSGVKRIRVWVTGTGGRTGAIPVNGDDEHKFASGGGGSGATAMSTLDVTNLASATIVIGDNAATTTAGRNVTFAGTGITTLVGGGGVDGGNPNGPAGGSAAPGGGGVATGGQVNLGGQIGEPAHAVGTDSQHGGDGGHAPGPVGGTYGMGAKGAKSFAGPATPVSGNSGCVFIEEYSDVSASLVGEKLVSHQLLTAASGTWTKPANVSKIRVFVVGAGGTASNSHSNTTSGGGGGGGTGVSIVDVTGLTTVAYTVTDTTSTFSLATPIVGLRGGTGSTTGNAQSGVGGAGGLATGADLIIPGGVGGSGRTSSGSGNQYAGGPGGLSYITPYGRGTRGIGPTGSGDQESGKTLGCIYIEEYTDPSLIAGGLSGVSDEEYIIPADAATTPTTGVWTRPAGVTQIEVQVMGAAGGGGRNPQTAGSAKAGKGGDGGLVSRIIDVRDIATIDYYVGARGLGATSGASTAGQNASFGHNGTALSTGLTVTVVSGVITAITNPGAAGSGMTLAPLIFIEPDVKTVGTAAGGTGATAVATISGGAVTGITVTNGGTGYVQGSVIASFGLNAIGGLGGGNATGATPGNSPSMGIGYGNKGNIKPWTMGTEGRTPSDPTDSTHGSTIREFGVGGVGGGPTSGTPGGNGQHGGIYIRSYR